MEITALYVPELAIGTSPSCCSDHQSFTENGFSAIGFFENVGNASNYPHYHSSTDELKYLDTEQMALISSAFMASTMTYLGPLERTLS